MKPARQVDGAPVVDVHAHLVPLDPAGIAAQAGVRLPDGGRIEIDGRPLPSQRLHQPAALVAWMDANGIEVALVSAPPPAYRQQLDAAAARRWTEYLNDGLAALAASHPGRLRVLAHLPLEHPELAADEAASRHGAPYAGFSLPAGGAESIRYADPALTPVWEALNAHASFAFVHPGTCADGRLAAFYAHNLLGNAYETAVAAGDLVFGGVIEDHPEIRFCLAHCGGAVPAVAGRWQRGFETARPGIDATRMPPRDALRHLWVDCVAHDHDLLALGAQVFGAERILLGSDWPFPMGLAKPREWLAELAPERQRDILADNFAALCTHHGAGES